MNLKRFMLSDRHQTKKTTYFMMLFKSNTQTASISRSVAAQGWGRGEVCLQGHKVTLYSDGNVLKLDFGVL